MVGFNGIFCLTTPLGKGLSQVAEKIHNRGRFVLLGQFCVDQLSLIGDQIEVQECIERFGIRRRLAERQTLLVSIVYNSQNWATDPGRRRACRVV